MGEGGGGGEIFNGAKVFNELKSELRNWSVRVVVEDEDFQMKSGVFKYRNGAKVESA